MCERKLTEGNGNRCLLGAKNYVGFFMKRSFKRSTPAAVLARGPYLQERTPVDVTVVVTAPSRNDDKEGLGGGVG